VPQVYLRNFAVGNQITVHLLPGGQEKTVSVRDAATMRSFYRRIRPDGSEIHDMEWSLSKIESVVGPLLRGIPGNWPPTDGAKHKLAEFFAFQAVRGPRWKAWHGDFVDKEVAKLREDPVHVMPSGIAIPLSEGQINDFATHIGSDTQWLMQMMKSANKLITVFGSMTWDLIQFDEPLLCLSDHPVVEWPIGVEQRRSGIAKGHGVANLLEVRAPLSPTLGLLMTWRDRKDGSQLLSGSTDRAANFNTFTIAQAEKQWMAKPGTSPAMGLSFFRPLSADFFPDYGSGYALHSVVRREVHRRLNAQLGERPTNEAVIVAVS
jgi:hypothetical protein